MSITKILRFIQITASLLFIPTSAAYAQNCIPVDVAGLPSPSYIDGWYTGDSSIGGSTFYSDIAIMMYVPGSNLPPFPIYSGQSRAVLMGGYTNPTTHQINLVFSELRSVNGSFTEEIKGLTVGSSQPFLIASNPVGQGVSAYLRRGSVNQGVATWILNRQDVNTNTDTREVHACTLGPGRSRGIQNCANGSTLIDQRSFPSASPTSRFEYAYGFSTANDSGVLYQEIDAVNGKSTIWRSLSSRLTPRILRTVMGLAGQYSVPMTALQGPAAIGTAAYLDYTNNFGTRLMTQDILTGALTSQPTAPVSSSNNNMRPDLVFDEQSTTMDYVFLDNGYISKYKSGASPLAVETTPGLLTLSSLISINGGVASQLLTYQGTRFILTSLCH